MRSESFDPGITGGAQPRTVELQLVLTLGGRWPMAALGRQNRGSLDPALTRDLPDRIWGAPRCVYLCACNNMYEIIHRYHEEMRKGRGAHQLVLLESP